MNRIAIGLMVVCAWGCTSGSSGDDTGTSPEPTDTDTVDTETVDTETVDTDTFENLGLCGTSGEAVVKSDSYQGTEDRYLIADKGKGKDICRVRVELRSIGSPDVPCDECEWAFVLEKSNVQVLADVDGGCENSHLRIDKETIAGLEGQRISYGYIPEYLGHIKILMRFDEESGGWVPKANVRWDNDKGTVSYDKNDGWCGY